MNLKLTPERRFSLILTAVIVLADFFAVGGVTWAFNASVARNEAQREIARQAARAQRDEISRKIDAILSARCGR